MQQFGNGLKFRDQPCSLMNCDWMVWEAADLDSAGGASSAGDGATVTSPGPAMLRPHGQSEELSRKLFMHPSHFSRDDISVLAKDKMICCIG